MLVYMESAKCQLNYQHRSLNLVDSSMTGANVPEKLERDGIHALNWFLVNFYF